MNRFKVDFNDAQKAEFIKKNGEREFNNLPYSDPRLGGSADDRKASILEKHPELKANEPKNTDDKIVPVYWAMLADVNKTKLKIY